MNKFVVMEKFTLGLSVINRKIKKAKLITDCGGINIILDRIDGDLSIDRRVESAENTLGEFSDLELDLLLEYGFKAFETLTGDEDYFIVGFYYEWEKGGVYE